MKRTIYFKDMEQADMAQSYVKQWQEEYEITEADFGNGYIAALDVADPLVADVLRDYECTDDYHSYDIVFNDDEKSNNKGFHETLQYCKEYIAMFNGTDFSYFADYQGGTVQIVCNETEEVEFETEVKIIK